MPGLYDSFGTESFDDLYKQYELDESIPKTQVDACLLYTSPSPRDYAASRMPSSA